MTTLSSLIVARQAASIAQVDEALARQVVRGGDLGTCLLELGVMSEQSLTSLLAEAHGFEPLAVGELAVASPAVLRLVPRAVALRHGLYPLEERDGELHVAVAEPLPQAVEDDLGFALGANLRQHAAPAVRIRQAVARDYGLPLDRRFLRLLAKLEHRPDPSPSDPPKHHDFTPAYPGSAAVRVSKFGTMIVKSAVPPPAPLDSEEVPDEVAPVHRIVAPPARRNTWPGVAGPAEVPLEPIPRAAPTPADIEESPAPAPVVQASPEPAPPAPSLPPEPPPLPERMSAAPPPSFIMEATAETAARVERRRRSRAEQASGKALLGWARRTLGNTIPSDRSPEHRRGPLTPAAAESQLEGASSGEQALAVFFAFARQYFEYAALFMVHGDLAAGHDAWGAGANRDKVRAIGVALDLPSALSFAKQRATPTLVQLKRAGLDGDLRSDLGRSAPQPVLVLPLMMRDRCVALLYGDDGDAAVSLRDIGEVVAMASLLAKALERIVLRKKRAALRDPSGVKSKVEVEVDRSRISPSNPVRASSPAADFSEVARKRGAWSEEDLVDEGWTLPADFETPEPTGRIETPVEGKRPSLPPVGPRRVPDVAEKPARLEDREEPPPEVLISEAEDASSMRELLEQIDDHPSPSPLNALASLRVPELIRRPIDPMASTSISAEAHPPPPSQGPFRQLPSVLIRSDLVDQVVSGGERAERALGEILALGEAAIPSVFARFPGPLTVDRNQALGELPRPADCGPVLRIVAAMRRLALPFLAVRSADVDVEVRFWATYLLGELSYSDAATALMPRLFDENPTVRRIAVRSARSLVGTGNEGSIRKSLERMIAASDEPLPRRLVALSTVGELKLHRAIPALIETLADREPAVVEGALRALAAMTRQEFGKDRRKWTDWWETKGKKRLERE